MNVHYDYYRIFYHVAQCGSFSRAAQRLGANQPNITRSINRLEAQLGCRLFLRSVRGVELTREGERLMEHVRVAYRHLRAAEMELKKDAELKGQTLAIGVSETALHLFLLDRLQWFRQAFPGVRLHISNHSTPQAMQALQAGQIDLAVVTTPADAPAPLRETPLLAFQEILVGGTQFEAFSHRRMSWKELARQPMVVLGRSTMTWSFYQRVFSMHGVAPQTDTQAETVDQILLLVRHNLGLGFLPEPMAREAIRRGEIFEIPLETPVPSRHVCLVQNSAKALSPAAEALRSLLCEEGLLKEEQNL